MKATGIPKNATGIGGFVNGAHSLVTPALVMVGAVAPIGLIAGGVVMMRQRSARRQERLPNELRFRRRR